MKRKKTAAYLLAAALGVSGLWGMTGCGDGQGVEESRQTAADTENTTNEENAVTTETQESADAQAVKAPLTDYLTDEQFALADQWNSCDDTALAAVMRKAAAGEKVTIACIGGSITQGTISNGSMDDEVGFKKCYADLFFEWWSDTFPDTEFDFINAGIGGTDSYLGVHRVQKEVLDYEPDLVLVEFSVNDGDTPSYKKSYDNLVRKILKSDSSPAVMLLFMGQTNGTTAQNSHVLVGFNYKLPMLSYHNVCKNLIETGTYTAGELSGDEVHPSAFGHAITGEILWKYLNQVYAQKDTYGEPEEFTADAVTYDTYLDAQILDATNLTPDSLGTFEAKSVCQQFPDGWVCESGEGDLTVTATFRNLGILYYATVDGRSGQFEIYVDGEAVRTIDADFSGGWGNAIKGMEVYTSDEAAEHTVTIRKAADSAGDVFDLLGFLTS